MVYVRKDGNIGWWTQKATKSYMKKNKDILARNFSQALFIQEKANNRRNAYIHELEGIKATLTNSNNFRQFLFCPSINTAEKQKILKAASISSVITHFLGLLIDFHSLDLLPQIIRDYTQRVRKESRSVEGIVYVAKKEDLTEALLQQLTQILKKETQKDVSLEIKDNKDISAGFTLELGDMYLDATLEKTLNSLIDLG